MGRWRQPQRVMFVPLLLALVVLVAACGESTPEPAGGAGPDDGGGEGEPDGDAGVSGPLLWYTSIPTVASAAVMDDFMAEYPDVQGEVLRLPTFELWERFQSEYEAGRNQADVVGFADYGVMEEAKQRGYVEEWLPDSIQEALDAGNIAESYVDPDGYWFSLRLTTQTFVYNSYNVPEEMGDLDSWLDLCDPAWGEYRLGTGDPREAAGIYEAFWQFNQAGFAEELFGCMADHDATVYALGGQQLNALMSGEIDAGIIVDYNAYQVMEAGAPLAVAMPSEGIGGSPDYNAKVVGAPNEEVAYVFLEWLGSQEGMESTARSLMTYVTRSDVDPQPDSRPPLSEITVLSGDYGDPEQAAADYESYNATWDQWMGR